MLVLHMGNASAMYMLIACEKEEEVVKGKRKKGKEGEEDEREYLGLVRAGYGAGLVLVVARSSWLSHHDDQKKFEGRCCVCCVGCACAA